jgi:hypothetical protein
LKPVEICHLQLTDTESFVGRLWKTDESRDFVGISQPHFCFQLDVFADAQKVFIRIAPQNIIWHKASDR